MEAAIRRQKDEALRALEEDRRNRERREQLRREHDESLARSVPRPVKRLPDPRPQPPPQRRRRIDASQAGMPFEAEDSLDNAVLSEYVSRPAPDASLPAVPFVKRNGTYWLGGRRCNADVDVENGQVIVKLGNDTEHFLTWIEKAERVEALRMKGLHSAQTIIALYQATASASRTRAVKT